MRKEPETEIGRGEPGAAGSRWKRAPLAWLICALTCLADVAVASPLPLVAVPSEVIAARPAPIKGRRSARERPANVSLTPYRMQLLLAPPTSLSFPLLAEMDLCKRGKPDPEPARPRPRARVDAEGIVIGDFHISPRLVLGTDNRYDDVNTRERAMRDERDYIDAKARGEIVDDPVTAMLRNRSKGCFLWSDPGFRMVLTMHQILQGGLRVPALLWIGPPPRSLESGKPLSPNPAGSTDQK